MHAFDDLQDLFADGSPADDLLFQCGLSVVWISGFIRHSVGELTDDEGLSIGASQSWEWTGRLAQNIFCTSVTLYPVKERVRMGDVSKSVVADRNFATKMKYFSRCHKWIFG